MVAEQFFSIAFERRSEVEISGLAAPRSKRELRVIGEYYESLWRELHSIRLRCSEQIHFEFRDGTQVPLDRAPDCFTINGIEVSSLEMQEILCRIVNFLHRKRNSSSPHFWEDRKRHGLPYEEDRRLIKWNEEKFVPPSDEEMKTAIRDMENFLRSIDLASVPHRPQAVQKLMGGEKN